MGFTRKQLGDVYYGCDGRCYYCGVEIGPFEIFEPDHMTPRALGGDDGLANLVLACRPCNRSKGNRTVDEYRFALTERVMRHADLALEAFNRIPRFGPNQELERLKDHLTNAAGYASVATVLFYGETHSLPREAYAPLRVRTLDVSALENPDHDLTMFEEAYLRLMSRGTASGMGKPLGDKE